MKCSSHVGFSLSSAKSGGKWWSPGYLILVYNNPLAAEGAMCTLYTFEKNTFKDCSLLKNQVCNINL